MANKTHPGKFRCYDAAFPDEPMFVILARDPAGPATLQYWAAKRDDMGKNETADDKDRIMSALSESEDMKRWRNDNLDPHGDGVPTWRLPRPEVTDDTPPDASPLYDPVKTNLRYALAVAAGLLHKAAQTMSKMRDFDLHRDILSFLSSNDRLTLPQYYQTPAEMKADEQGTLICPLSVVRITELLDYATCYGEFDENTPSGTISEHGEDMSSPMNDIRRHAIWVYKRVLGLIPEGAEPPVADDPTPRPTILLHTEGLFAVPGVDTPQTMEQIAAVYREYSAVMSDPNRGIVRTEAPQTIVPKEGRDRRYYLLKLRDQIDKLRDGRLPAPYNLFRAVKMETGKGWQYEALGIGVDDLEIMLAILSEKPFVTEDTVRIVGTGLTQVRDDLLAMIGEESSLIANMKSADWIRFEEIINQTADRIMGHAAHLTFDGPVKVAPTPPPMPVRSIRTYEKADATSPSGRVTMPFTEEPDYYGKFVADMKIDPLRDYYERKTAKAAELGMGYGGEKAPTVDSKPEDLAHAPEVPRHRFSTFHDSGDYAYARGLEVAPQHLPTALNAMACSGWHLVTLFGQTESKHVGFIFKRGPATGVCDDLGRGLAL